MTTRFTLVHVTKDKFSIYDEIFGHTLAYYTPTDRDIVQNTIDSLNSGTLSLYQLTQQIHDYDYMSDPDFGTAVTASNVLHEWFALRNIDIWELGHCMSRSHK